MRVEGEGIGRPRINRLVPFTGYRAKLQTVYELDIAIPSVLRHWVVGTGVGQTKKGVTSLPVRAPGLKE